MLVALLPAKMSALQSFEELQAQLAEHNAQLEQVCRVTATPSHARYLDVCRRHHGHANFLHSLLTRPRLLSGLTTPYVTAQ